MTKIYICDFNDSFTYNIFSTLKLMNSTLDLEVVPYSRLLSFLQILNEESHPCGVVLGPGPGHPDEYEFLQKSLQKLYSKKNIFILGICLGHQLIWNGHGLMVTYCSKPEHGQVVTYKLPKNLSERLGVSSQIEVQRYNSLSVKISSGEEQKLKRQQWLTLSYQKELIIAAKDNILTYQFHPESIGTTCPQQFFTPMLKFLL